MELTFSFYFIQNGYSVVPLASPLVETNTSLTLTCTTLLCTSTCCKVYHYGYAHKLAVPALYLVSFTLWLWLSNNGLQSSGMEANICCQRCVCQQALMLTALGHWATYSLMRLPDLFKKLHILRKIIIKKNLAWDMFRKGHHCLFFWCIKRTESHISETRHAVKMSMAWGFGLGQVSVTESERNKTRPTC